MIKAVIFDLDNTLVDFMKMKGRAVEAACNAMIDAGLNITLQNAIEEINSIYKEYGMEYQKVFDQFIQKQIGKINYKILASGIVAYRKAREAELIPYPHVNSTLIDLSKKGYKLGILSDAPIKEAWMRLAYMNFHHLFDAIVTFDDTRNRKPDPEPFNVILAKLDVMPYEAIMVGDWFERDIIGASNVGMKTVFARYGDAFNTQNHNADFEINDVSELIVILEQLNKK